VDGLSAAERRSHYRRIVWMKCRCVATSHVVSKLSEEEKARAREEWVAQFPERWRPYLVDGDDWMALEFLGTRDWLRGKVKKWLRWREWVLTPEWRRENWGWGKAKPARGAGQSGKARANARKGMKA
jgi:hypothetical protein